MKLTEQDCDALRLVALGSVFRWQRRDVRRGRDAPITVPTARLYAAGLIRLKTTGRVALTWAGKKARAEIEAYEQVAA